MKLTKSHTYYIINFVIITGFIMLTSCLNNHEEKLTTILDKEQARQSQLSKIKERGLLIALTDYNSTSYFLYRGEPMGYQYDKLRLFADYLGVDLEVRISNDLDRSFRMLDQGEVDIIAMGLTVTQKRSNRVDFTKPHSQSRQVLVQRKPENWRKMRTWDEVESKMIRNALDLADKVVYVQKGTNFSDRMKNLANEIGDTIYVIQSENEVEELISMVARGEIDYTVADEHVALVNEKYYSNIDVQTPVSFPQHIAWAVKKGNDSLRMEANHWLNSYLQSAAAGYIYDKYFRNPRQINIAQSEFHSVRGGKVSQYDDIIRSIGEKYNIDWRLLASMIYQESRFHPEVKSWMGAFGIMQLMPHTAALYGVDTTSSVEEQIAAGVKFIGWIDRQLPESIEDPVERTKFILASYNVGIAHVYDARRLAEKYGKDPNRWTDNVDLYILQKSDPKYYNDSVVKYGYARGEETFKYVVEILERYEHYKKVLQ
ncbi:MAG: transporter substrate-binding domain-containing protein [Bacteroidetes bacterium]|nr:transporter substrate-binding domain-containing protein [Bacteroidota bacterium]